MRNAPSTGVPALESEARTALGGESAGTVVLLVTSRSARVRLTPIADALTTMGVPQVLFDPFTADPDPSAEALMGTIEETLDRLRPAAVLVAGDADAAVAGALVANRLGLWVGRIGAGLRCDDWSLPEEVARVVLDTVADELFTDGPDATLTLITQGYDRRSIVDVGNTLADSVNRWRGRAAVRAVWRRFGLSPREYVLAAIQRDENVGGSARVARLTAGLTGLARRHRVLLMLHPRARAAFEPGGELEALRAAGVVTADPVDHLDFLSLVLGAGAVLTDSAGVQEETTLLGVRCFTLRHTTERTLTLTLGSNVLLGDNPSELAAIEVDPRRIPVAPIPRWDGQAGRRVAEQLLPRVNAARAGA